MEAMELERNGTQTAGGEHAEDNGRPEGSLNALLKDSAELQSQFDRLVSKALNTARSNWEKERSDVEGQTAELERAFLAREQAMTARERRASAATVLGERGLPMELAECVDYQDDDSVRRSLETLEKSFAAGVQKAVRERLKGVPPKSGCEAAYASQMRAALGLK